MQHYAANDDKPDLGRYRDPSAWPLLVVSLAMAVIIGGYAYRDNESSPEARQEPQPATGPAVPVEQGPSHPLPAPQAAPFSLPSLDNSDSMLRQSLAALMGRQSFDELILPDGLVRRIVATVDNLPRETVPRRVIPLAAVPGSFTPGQYARYAPYVRVLEAIDEPALVRDYVRAYPLFQRAYQELGYPGRYFNDRLLEAIDDLLAAPELGGALELLQPRVLYEFADPDLETRSAGQKIMIRMGPENAARVKAKLRALRQELLAAARRR